MMHISNDGRLAPKYLSDLYTYMSELVCKMI